MQDRNIFDREALSFNITPINNGFHDNPFSYGFGDTQPPHALVQCVVQCIKNTIKVFSRPVI